MREPKNQMLGTMEPPLMQLSVKSQVRDLIQYSSLWSNASVHNHAYTCKRKIVIN